MIIFHWFPARYPREGDRLEFVLGFNMRSATLFVEKSFVGCVYTFQLTLDRLTRQTIPMRVCRLFQLGQMSRHRIIVHIRQSIFITLTLPQFGRKRGKYTTFRGVCQVKYIVFSTPRPGLIQEGGVYIPNPTNAIRAFDVDSKDWVLTSKFDKKVLHLRNVQHSLTIIFAEL